MLAYRQLVTVKNPQHIVLSNLPLQVGQQVEVLILVKNDVVEENRKLQQSSVWEDSRLTQDNINQKSVINPAQVYTDAEWEKLEPDLRSELETQYILNNPILMKQIQDQSEWFTVSPEQLGINLKD